MSRGPLNQLNDQSYDVIVIGAGAVGCAAARQLAGRGFRTLIVDRGDIGAGTSSRSSRMLYSGLGYLAARYPLWQMVFRPFDMLQRLKYTRDVMQCRAELVREMPNHLTKHKFHYPFRAGDQYPAWLVDIGFRVVEALGGWKVPLSYRRTTRAKAGQESALASGLSDNVKSVGFFEEYMYAWAERICVDTVLDAERRGATVRTYSEVAGLTESTDGWYVQLADRAPGSNGKATVKAKLVINATGPWVDRVPGAGGSNAKRVIGIKGVNVMVRLPEAYKGLGLEAFSSKGEPYYVFPWRDYHFIGPTESEFTDNPDNVRVEDQEIDYILKEANTLFPKLKLTRDHVLHCWCGVRPTSTINGHETSLPVRLSEVPGRAGILTITGSTIMLHRHAGRLIAKAVESRLGKRNAAPKGLLAGTKVDVSNVDEVLRNEHVVRLSDLVRRRLPCGLEPDLGRSKAEELSVKAAKILGWSEERRLEELAAFEADTAKVYRQLTNSLAKRKQAGAS
ncbi:MULTISPECIES: FAD-dependent oxidoreductase [Pseudomonas]|uniref:FAD-dependent oxidoreductase n=1 Tax=Pseudomonas promysalinigenes TaxID=485898 RepID=A0ABY6AHT4_9PSED|nr:MULTISPECIES: FAD-dependent oxidoreductase [Pseudomonas]AUA33504.1 FAD-dependent oxidoreductase [Pseudomonas sp. SGAir0191]UXH38803.1 FAD-dependent oxidoreductase [Pseudomonas promysalinigenes]